MTATKIPDVSYLMECFSLKGGDLYWNERPESHFPQGGSRPSSQIAAMWNAKLAGKRAGRVMKSKFQYRQVGVNGVRYLEHRIIAAMTGISLDGVIDHVDGNGLNNDPSNLRAATQQQNCMNHSGWRRRSGYPGVYQTKRLGGSVRWIAILRVDGKSKSAGTFDTYEQAVSARMAAEVALRGEFALSHSRFRDRVSA